MNEVNTSQANPAMGWQRFNPLHHAPLWLKLMTLVAALIIPLVVLTLDVVKTRSAEFSAIDRAQSALAMAGLLKDLQLAVATHRGQARVAISSGETAAAAKTVPTAKKIDELFASLTKVNRAMGEQLGTTESIPALTAQWQDVKNWKGRTEQDSFNRHEKLDTALIAAQGALADQSGLTVFPDLAINYLGQIALRSLPTTASELNFVRKEGLRIIKAQGQGGVAPPADRELVFQMVTSPRIQMRQIERTYQTAFEYNPELRSSLETAFNTTVNSTQNMLRIIDEQLLAASGISIERDPWFKMVTDTVETYFALYQVTLDQLSKALDVQRAELKRQTQAQAWAVGLLLLFSGLLAWLIVSQITGPTQRMIRAFAAISAGELDQPVAARAGQLHRRHHHLRSGGAAATYDAGGDAAV